MSDATNTERAADLKDGKPPVQIQIMSDLHLETPRFRPMYGDFVIEPQCPNLALLGDIGYAEDSRLFTFLEVQLRQFDLVFFVLGNHEPYHGVSEDEEGTYHSAISKLEKFEAEIIKRKTNNDLGANEHEQLGRFVFLNRKRFDISAEVSILGCTLFSKIEAVQQRDVSMFVSDFWETRNWAVESHNEAHETDLTWLNSQVDDISRSEGNRKIIILTHYSPTTIPATIDPEHHEDPRGVQSAFCTNLEMERCWTSSSVKAWAFGHTHFNCDLVEDKTGKRILANQRGYGNEDAFDFEPEKVLCLEM